MHPTDQPAREPEPTEFNVILPPLETEAQRERYARSLQNYLLRRQHTRLRPGEPERLLTIEFQESERPTFEWPSQNDVTPLIVFATPADGEVT